MPFDIPTVVPGRFVSDLWVRPLLDGRNWEIVDHPFSYLSSKGLIVVPVGFVTDFASVPRILWDVYPPWGTYGWAAVIHDFLYTTQLFDRENSDYFLLEAMGASGVDEWTRGSIYDAVRSCGGHSWDEHKDILKGVNQDYENAPKDFVTVVASRRGRGLPDIESGIQGNQNQSVDTTLSAET